MNIDNVNLSTGNHNNIYNNINPVMSHTINNEQPKNLFRKMKVYLPYVSQQGRISFRPNRKYDTIAE